MRRIKIATGQYYLRMLVIKPDPTQSYWQNVAVASKTGTRRDNYPWEWYLLEGLSFGQVSVTGTADSLKACVDIVESRVKQYGLMEMETVETDGDSTKPA